MEMEKWNNVPKKVNRHLLKALDFLQTSKTDFVSVEAIQHRVRWSLRRTKPVDNLEDVVLEALKTQAELGIITRYGSSMYAKALGFPGLPPKKVNKHVLKAFRFLQTSREDFVNVEDIQDRVKRSLRHTKPVSNLEGLVKQCLRKQTELGILTRSGPTKYAMTRAFQGVRPVKKEQFKKTETDEEAKLREVRRKVKKHLIKLSKKARQKHNCQN